MTNVPDFRGRIEGDKPQDFFHRVAGMIPGYTGYQDKERRREADKELRMYLARQFRDQHGALVRVQQQIARSRHLEAIGEVDRLAGVLQRFIDKLETATQGYAGLFDPVKIQEAELDQLYTFDAALTDGLQQVTNAIASVGSAAQQGTGATSAGDFPELQTTLTQLSTTLDELLNTWNHRNDVIMSGRPMPAADFDKFRANVSTPAYPGPAAPGPQQASGPQSYGSPAAGPQSYGSPAAGPQSYGSPTSGQPYQPYSGPTGPAGETENPTRRLDGTNPAGGYPPSSVGERASDVGGSPTGGPTEHGPQGGQ